LPITGELDISAILNKLGDPDHGLVPAKPINPGGEDVFRASWGETDMSTSLELALPQAIIWDVNGYYRSLGFGRPYRPTKKELRLAYQRNGRDDRYLTYVMKQLVNKRIRKDYDESPLGSRFRDIYVIQEEHEKLIKVAQEMSEEECRLVTVKEVEERLGDPLKRDLPELNKEVQYDYHWDWGYYLLRSRKPEVENLIEWQQLLARAFTEAGLVRTIAIGYIGNTKEEVVVQEFEGRTVIFLNESSIPNPGLAKRAVALYRAHQREDQNDSTSTPYRRSSRS
jgi:hypothetical protein